MLTVLVALAGGAAVVWGWARAVRSAFGRNDPMLARRRRRTGLALVAVGALLALTPDLWAGLLAGGGPRAGWATAALWAYRLVVLGWLLVVALSLVATSRRVTAPVRRAVDAGRARVILAGSARLAPVRRVRRPADLRGFPLDWDSLVDLEGRLSSALLRYEHDLEARSNRPAMHDYADPHTAAALQAMLRADALRTPTPPPGTRDVLDTDYGRAVVDLAAAVEAAEANAAARATSGVGAAERDALDLVELTVAFLRDNDASPSERAAAYAELTARLGTAREQAGAADPARVRAHPWLDVTERATTPRVDDGPP